jgi:outer membrane protein assembly factor BamA
VTEKAQIKQWSVFQESAAQEAVSRLVKLYEDKGYYSAKIHFKTKAVEGRADQIQLIFKIQDFEKAAIKRIQFLNNTPGFVI